MMNKKLAFALFCIVSLNLIRAQIGESERRYVRIGSLQTHISAYGSERAYNNSYYEGLQWPADYHYQDNSVIKRSWLAAKDFTDANGDHWDTWGVYITKSEVENKLFPVRLDQTTKFAIPSVFVDGVSNSAPYQNDWDGDPRPDQIPDRIITNTVNTTLGLTFIRRVLVFSQQYHENYLIKEIILKNTGNVDYDDDIELTTDIHDVRIGWGTRYSVSREGAMTIDGNQSWGKFSWVTRRGENYTQHANDVITEANPIVDWIRCGFSWFGQSENVSFDNIGAPKRSGSGRLTAPQFAGTAVLHVDKSVSDRSDDPNQPAVLGWHAGDSYPYPEDEASNLRTWNFLAGDAYPAASDGGTNRFYEDNVTGIIDPVVPYSLHGDGGGTNVWLTYGPFDIPHGDSIVIVEAEGISGLNRQMCEMVGANWLTNTPGLLPDGGTTTNRNEYKNAWVYTGIDSILMTFSRALRNYRSGYNIPQPPQPPSLFNIVSGGDRIALSWLPSPGDGNNPDFGGYKIFRAIGKPDTTFEEIYIAAPGETFFDDKTAIRGQSYYYYVVAFNDGSNNPGETNPGGPLYSSRFYTKTSKEANLKRQAGTDLAGIRVVPNPFHLRAAQRNMQFVANKDRLMFYNIPGKCRIRIYTERGDLVDEILHTDGSGDEIWDSMSSSRQTVVSGIYIAHFEVMENTIDDASGEINFKKGVSTYRKFVIIR